MAVNPLVESAVESIELDAFAKNIPDLIFKGTTGYSFFKKRATTIPVSNETAAGGVARPSFRVPFRVQSGAALSQGTGNADSLLRGTGSQWQAFAVSPVFLYSVCEISYLSQQATKGKQRGLINVQAQEMKNSLQQAMQGCEALINGDGSGALDQIPSTATVVVSGGSGQEVGSITGLNVAAAFADQQTISVFPSEGGTSRGTFVISYIDPVAQAIYSASPGLPAGTQVTDYLMINGSSGAVASSVLGVKAWDVNSNTGTIGGLNRANFPGRLSCPTINLGGSGITPGVGNRAQVILGRAMGPDAAAIDGAVWYGGPEQALAGSNLFYNTLITQNKEAGDSTPDVGRKFFNDTLFGREFVKSWTAVGNRLDLLLPKNWYIGEMIELSLYDFGGGNTVMPVPDVGTTNGTYLTSQMFAYNACFNLVNSAPRQGLYVQDIGEPTV
jgi:hypothetical protein